MQYPTPQCASSAPSNKNASQSLAARRRLARQLVFLTIAAVGCTVDLATKSWIFGRLGMPGTSQPIWVVPEVFSLTTSLNEGALFGMGQGLTMLFAWLSIFAAVAIVYWYFFGDVADSWWLTIALGSVMAGILGNLYDRLGLPGLKWHVYTNTHEPGNPVYAVRDWLHFNIEGVIDWPVFNVADSLLVCGAVMIALWQFRR